MLESSSESDATDDDSNTFFTFGKKGKIFRVANATDCAIYIGEQADRVLGGGGASLGVGVAGYGGKIRLPEKQHNDGQHGDTHRGHHPEITLLDGQ